MDGALDRAFGELTEAAGVVGVGGSVPAANIFAEFFSVFDFNEGGPRKAAAD
jgi:hypothetical protein